MTTCRSGGPGAGEAAGCGKTWAGEAEGCSFSRFYLLALRVSGSGFRLAFLRIFFVLQSGERPLLSSGTGILGSFLQFPRSCPVGGAGDGADTGHSGELLPWQLGPMNWGEETAVLTFWPNTSV